MKQFDAIIHLATVSNDPIGNKFEKATKNINYEASIELLKQAIKNNIKNLYSHLFVVFMDLTMVQLKMKIVQFILWLNMQGRR